MPRDRPVVSIQSAVTRRVPARVGLVGNPSDGYGGAVLATVVPALAATVEATPGEGITFGPVDEPIESWPTLDAWRDHVGSVGHGDAQRIISAALWTLVDHLDRRDGRHRLGIHLRWSTDVPRSVGLAGSSALAVGVIDAAAQVWGRELDRRVAAALALRAERDVLGVAAGWQDRIVQSFGRTVLVDATVMQRIEGVEVPEVRGLALPDGTAMSLLVAWSSSAAGDSHDYHAPLRRAGAALAGPMAQLASLAREAAQAWTVGDAGVVGASMDAGWQIRQTCAPLRPDHAALVDVVRTAGVPATTPGSGGAVVALIASADARARALAALAGLGCDHLVISAV